MIDRVWAFGWHGLAQIWHEAPFIYSAILVIFPVFWSLFIIAFSVPDDPPLRHSAREQTAYGFAVALRAFLQLLAVGIVALYGIASPYSYPPLLYWIHQWAYILIVIIVLAGASRFADWVYGLTIKPIAGLIGGSSFDPPHY